MAFFTFNNLKIQVGQGDSSVLEDFLSFGGNLNISTAQAIQSTVGGNRFQVPNGPRQSSLSFSYYPTGANDTITDLTGDFNSGSDIVAFGITGHQCYLNSINFTVTQYQPVRIQADFSIYGEIEGSVGAISQAEKIEATELIPHAVETQLANFDSTNLLITGIQSVSVGYQCSRTPEYTLGNRFPEQGNVPLLGLIQNVTINGSDWKTILNYSGTNIGNAATIQLRDINSNNIGLPYQITGKVVSQDLSLDEGGLLRGTVTIQNVIV